MSIQISNLKEYFETLPQRFEPSSAKGLHAIYQYEISGEGGGVYHVKVADGTMDIVEGYCDSPSGTLKLSAQDFVDLANGKASGAMLYIKGRLKATGNIMLVQRMQAIFPPSKP